MPRRPRPTWRELVLPAVSIVATLYVMIARGVIAAVIIGVLCYAIVKVDDAIDDHQDGADDDAQ